MLEVFSSWVISTACIFIIWIILLMLMAAIPDQDMLLHHIEAGYSALLALTVSLLFLTWGVLLIRKLTRNRFGASRHIVQNIAYMCMLCCTIFLIRAVCVALDSWAFPSNPLGLYVDHWLLYMLCEFISAWLLLFLILKSPASRPSNSSSGSQIQITKPKRYTNPFEEQSQAVEHESDPTRYLFSTALPLSDTTKSDDFSPSTPDDSDNTSRTISWAITLSESDA